MSSNALKEIAPEEPERRSFLKFLFLGSGVAVAGGVLNSLKFNTSNSSSSSAATLFSKFRVVENREEISIRTKDGEELLVIEKNV